MRRPWQYTLLGAAIAFFVLYGIELASDGVEDVYGPAEPRTERSVPGIAANAGDPYPSGGRVGAQAGARDAVGPDSYGARPQDQHADPGSYPGWDDYGPTRYEEGYGYDDFAEGRGGVSRLADGTAGLLQSLAKGGIRFVVSLFESVAR
jgi:hypothetical protein